MLNAHTISKVRAHTQYITSLSNHLSFRKGQAFYVLSTNVEDGLYFVSTHYATPFSRNAVCGLVPIHCFQIVDLDSKLAAANQDQAKVDGTDTKDDGKGTQRVVSDQNKLKSEPQVRQLPLFKTITNQSIQSVKLLDFDSSQTNDPEREYIYGFKVEREGLAHIVFRTFKDVKFLHQNLQFNSVDGLPELSGEILGLKELKRAHILASRTKQQHFELSIYISKFFEQNSNLINCRAVTYFFEPHFPIEMEQVLEKGQRDTKVYGLQEHSKEKANSKNGSFLSNFKSKSRSFLRT